MERKGFPLRLALELGAGIAATVAIEKVAEAGIKKGKDYIDRRKGHEAHETNLTLNPDDFAGETPFKVVNGDIQSIDIYPEPAT